MSHLERGPAEFLELKILSELRELAWIWESSLWQSSHSNRAPSVHLQDRSRPKYEQVVADSGRSSTQCSTNLPDFGLAPSGKRHKFGRPDIYGPRLNACPMGEFGQGGVTRPGSLYRGRVAREIAGKARNSAWKGDEEWAIHKFWQRSHRFPHEFTDSSLDLPVFLVARATFTNSF